MAPFNRTRCRHRSWRRTTVACGGSSMPRRRRCWRAADMERVVFLFDVDNTLLDNNRISADLKRYLTKEVGAGRQEQYWEKVDRSGLFEAVEGRVLIYIH